MLLELRPVYAEDPPVEWGIRNQKLRLNEAGWHLHANSPSVRVTPELVATAEHVDCPDDDSQLRLKTWLGLRYDRPAIPERYGKVAGALSDQLRKRKNRPQGARLRDILAQFRTSSDGMTEYTLVAVVPSRNEVTDNSVMEIRVWLADITRAIPAELGTPILLEVYGDDVVSLRYIESSFSLDVSSLSWPQNSPGPVGQV